MRRIALTIDLDFFCRELVEWDWGHSEAPDRMGIDDVIWFTRYVSPQFDLMEETNISEHADCFPSEILYKLKNTGYNITNNTMLGAGWSHGFAYNFFSGMEFDDLVNIDAHHDIYGGNEVNCGSWVRKLRETKQFNYTWVYPKWLPREYINRTRKLPFKYSVVSLSNALKINGNVVGIYIAQSPSWVPPHLNHHIDQLVMCSMLITGKQQFDVDDGLMVRKPIDTKEILKVRKQLEQSYSNMSKQTLPPT